MNTEILHTVDARGMACPMPTIRLGQAIRKINIGEVIELWTDDPGSQGNMAVWTKNTGHELLADKIEAGVFKYQVKRIR